MATSNTPAVSTAIDMAKESMVITFSSGDTICLTLDQLSADIATQAMWHGLKQKLVDAAAISRDPVTGRSATASDKYRAALEVYERLISGQWNKAREGGAQTGGLLLSALMAVYPTKTREQLVTYLAGKSAEEKTALRKVAKIADAIELIKLARAKDDGIDGDSLLDELDD